MSENKSKLNLSFIHRTDLIEKWEKKRWKSPKTKTEIIQRWRRARYSQLIPLSTLYGKIPRLAPLTGCYQQHQQSDQPDRQPFVLLDSKWMLNSKRHLLDEDVPALAGVTTRTPNGRVIQHSEITSAGCLKVVGHPRQHADFTPINGARKRYRALTQNYKEENDSSKKAKYCEPNNDLNSDVFTKSWSYVAFVSDRLVTLIRSDVSTDMAKSLDTGSPRDTSIGQDGTTPVIQFTRGKGQIFLNTCTSTEGSVKHSRKRKLSRSSDSGKPKTVLSKQGHFDDSVNEISGTLCSGADEPAPRKVNSDQKNGPGSWPDKSDPLRVCLAPPARQAQPCKCCSPARKNGYPEIVTKYHTEEPKPKKRNPLKEVIRSSVLKFTSHEKVPQSPRLSDDKHHPETSVTDSMLYPCVELISPLVKRQRAVRASFSADESTSLIRSHLSTNDEMTLADVSSSLLSSEVEMASAEQGIITNQHKGSYSAADEKAQRTGVSITENSCHASYVSDNQCRLIMATDDKPIRVTDKSDSSSCDVQILPTKAAVSFVSNKRRVSMTKRLQV